MKEGLFERGCCWVFFFCLSVIFFGFWSFVTKMHSRNSGKCTCTCSPAVGSTPSSVEACGYVKRHIMLAEKKRSPSVHRLGSAGTEPTGSFHLQGLKTHWLWSSRLHHAGASPWFYVHVGGTGDTRWRFSACTTARSDPIRPV